MRAHLPLVTDPGQDPYHDDATRRHSQKQRTSGANAWQCFVLRYVIDLAIKLSVLNPINLRQSNCLTRHVDAKGLQ